MTESLIFSIIEKYDFNSKDSMWKCLSRYDLEINSHQEGGTGMSDKRNKKEDSDILLKAIDALLPDMVKKLVLTGIGGVMLTEEAVRKILSELNLSKDIAALVLAQTNKAKAEVVKVVSNELRNQIKEIDLHNEINDILKDTKVRIQMEIDFESKSDDDVSLNIRQKINKKTTVKKPAVKK